MFLEEDFIAWVAAQGITRPGYEDDLPDAPPQGQPGPHRAYSVAISGGLGTELGDFLDRPTFTVLTRGVSRRDARDGALEIDGAWLDAEPMIFIGDYQLKGKGRFGGPPAFVAIDDDGHVLRAATYWCRIVR